MGPPGEGFTADAGSPFALALAAARAAYERHDVNGMDSQYRKAVRLAPDDQANLGTAVAVEHISRLRRLDDSTRALARCEEYLAGDGENVRLLLQRAETDLVRGDFSRIDAELVAIRRIAGEWPLRQADDALLSRIEGLAADRQSRFSLVLRHLRKARDSYAALGNNAALTVIDDDIRAVTLRRGPAVPTQSVSAPDLTPQARLTRSEELRVIGRYEEALDELASVPEGSLDPAVRFFFLEAKVRLLRLLRADGEADELMPKLYDAARVSARPAENLLAAQRLDLDCATELGAVATCDLRIQDVRRLVRDGRLDEAERVLLAERAPAEPDDRHTAEWHLAAGELTMAIAVGGRTPALVRKAAGHFQESVRHAAADSLVAIRITALRLLGHAHAMLSDTDKAVEAWAGAHRLEESVAALQPTDDRRIPMLRAAPDEFDERIRVAARAIEREPLAAATVVVAMEAARGAAILPRILPDQESLVRDLPSPGDIAGARRWVRQIVRGLPRSQIIWMLHATPDHVHHAFIDRRTLRHVSVPCGRDDLIKSIDALADCWQSGVTFDGELLVPEPGSITAFDRRLREIARRLGLHRIPELPKHVTRIAVVAGGELSEIPFALLPCPRPDGTVDRTLIGRQYALSDLPCISVRHPLHRRSRAQRGTRGTQMLLLQPDPTLTAAAEVAGRTVLTEEQATPAALRAELKVGRYRQVRIDSHGAFNPDPSDPSDKPQEPVIRLAPAGAEGCMSPEEFQAMALGATGTVVLGACETGMVKRIGRDERTGFVRAGLLSGASAVLAARWEALDLVAARILDRFEKNLRYYPRDVALFLAQRAEDTREPPPRCSAAEAHPSRWAVWTLYGDVGYQTRLGPVRRWLFRPWIRIVRHLGSSDE